MAASERYAHGHDESVLRSHRWRTAENSAAFLLPHLVAGQSVLDAGCGPGTITLDLAARVFPGRVHGIDSSPTVIDLARQACAQRTGVDATFAVGDVYSVDADDASFDVVYVHQVLHHLADPVAALGELRRVLRPGGLLAVRESDYGAFFWDPADALLERWRTIFQQIAGRNGADANAGRHVHRWARAAGFTDLVVSSSTWTFQHAEDRAWWGDSWADRVRRSEFARQSLEYGLSTDAELAEIAIAFRRWAADDDGLFVVVHGEVLARR